ncbi:triphosphoribosyl-dephospho-CoA synthase [uncultured Sphaerotilus sp.]|uniref:triphosphoribosyl-dephospho-CoA synthase n=1 Tax=uncultured Sphaerotilus sp. TaxID=474984 RepID=UPI0030CA50D5
MSSLRRAFLDACAWDVAVRKPGNVSVHSAGHGMEARTFLDSAGACVGALCRPGAPVGARIEQAVAATWARVGCNTNLGILLLCAPIAVAAERAAAPVDEAGLRQALADVMATLTVEDAAAAFRAIVQANPGGLGAAAQQDVRQAPTVTLREAMVLAAGRDRIAAQYRDGGAALFDTGLRALRGGEGVACAVSPQAVQRVYLAWLASDLDAHIVRKHGPALAQIVLNDAQRWSVRAAAGERLDADPAFQAWDEALKSAAINPGTSADLTVATLMLAALLDRGVGGRCGTERV